MVPCPFSRSDSTWVRHDVERPLDSGPDARKFIGDSIGVFGAREGGAGVHAGTVRDARHPVAGPLLI